MTLALVLKSSVRVLLILTFLCSTASITLLSACFRWFLGVTRLLQLKLTGAP